MFVSELIIRLDRRDRQTSCSSLPNPVMGWEGSRYYSSDHDFCVPTLHRLSSRNLPVKGGPCILCDSGGSRYRKLFALANA
jgi:hypothetical protein